jgi:glutathione S-transferase
MAKPLLIIGNKNYSSWSLRPYMALSMAGIAFDEKLERFGDPRFAKAVKAYGAAGRVPILQHNGLTVWDSLAIIEYAADTWPDKNIWPKNAKARAMARTLSAEMHSGFQALRNVCPMNLRRPPKAIQLSDDVYANVARIEKIWREARASYGKGGPFLFGKFSGADAMFTPVATRFRTFAIPVKPDTQKYMDAIFATSAFQQWYADSVKEKWVYPADEVD